VKPHAFHPEADAEYAEAARFYTEIQPELGGRFFDEIESAIATVCAHPRQFHEFEPPVRRCLARRFPYAIVYLEEPDQVWIVAVMHLHRQPGYWHGRLG
jgi:plasmid stabilization system protein ParE